MGGLRITYYSAMGRRSFISIAIQAARAADRAARQHEREQLRHARALERDMRRMERDEKRLYQEERAAETEALNEELHRKIDSLERLLANGIERDPRVNWRSLAYAPPRTEVDALLVPPHVPPFDTLLPPRPGPLARLIPGSEARRKRRGGEN